MRRLGKFFIWLILALIIIYVALALVLHYAINPQTYKRVIETNAYKYTGHKLKINGDLAWSVFPHPMLKINDVIIENQKGMDHVSPYFAKIKEANIRLNFLPLISGHVEPSLISLNGANLNLVYQSKKNNPQSVKASAAIKTKPTKQTTQQKPSIALKDDQQSRKTYLQHVTIPVVMIHNTNINWINLKTNDITNLKNIDLVVRPKADRATVKGHITILHDKLESQLDLATTVMMNQQQQLLTLNKLTLKGTLQSKYTNTFDLTSNIVINFKNQTLKINPYTATWNKLPMQGLMQMNWKTGDTGLNVSFDANTKLAGGSILEKGRFIMAHDKDNSLSYNLDMKSINLKPLLKSIHYNNDIDGMITLSAKLTASNQNHSWLNNLDGSGAFSLSKAQFGSINPVSMLNHAFDKLHRGSLDSSSSQVTVFNDAKGTFKIHNGVIYNNDLVLTAKNITTKGNGNINLPAQLIDYHLFLKRDGVNDITVPVIISGNLHHPNIKADYERLGASIINKALDKKSFKKIFNDKKLNIKGIF